MLKYLLVALVTLELIFLSVLIPANATSTPTPSESYTWQYAYLGSTEKVCKKVIVQPEDRPVPKSSDMQPINVQSLIVDDHYCAGQTK
jgi:hypothetical protein